MASLQHDASGFLVGERLVNGIDLVGRDTTEILKILKSSIGLQQASNNRLRVTLDRINNQSQRRVIDVTPTPLPVHRIGNNSQQLPTVDIGAPTSDVQPTIEHGHDSGRVDDARLSDIDNPIPTPNENTNGSPTQPIQDIEPALPPAPLDDGRRNNGRRNSPPSDDPDSNNNRHGNGLRRNARGQFEGDNAPPVDITPPDDGRRGNGRRRNARGQFEGDNAPPTDDHTPDDGRRGNGRRNSPPSDDPDSNNNRHGNGLRRNARGQFEGDNAPPVDITPPDDGRRGNGRRRNARGQFEGDNAPPTDDHTPDDGRRNNGRRNSPPSDDPDSNNNRHGNGLRRNARGQGDNAPPVDIIPPDDGRRGNGRRRNARGQFEGDNAPPTDDHTPDDGRRNNGRRRNSRGQFEGDGLTDEERKRKAEEAAKAKAEKEANDNLKKSIMEGISLGNTDTHNIDPTVDAVRELGDLMSPLAKVGKTMFKGAAWLFRRKKKREEPSDQEQRQQSRIEKLLKRIAGSRVGQAAGSGFNLFGGLFSSLTGTAGSLLSGLGKILTGAILPALGLTAAFKLGEWVGGKIYEAIAPTIADAIEWTVDAVKKAGDAYNAVVAKATSGIEAGVEIYNNAVANTTDNMVKLSDKTKGILETGKGVYKQAVENTADNMKKAADLGGELWSGVKILRQQAVDKLSGGMTYVADKIKPSKSVNDNQMMVFKAFKSTGMGDAQAKAMTAEVGRENDYNDKYLYGTHTDDKNGVTNQGMFSWQKDRRAKLVDFMQKRGLVDKGGNFAKGQESLNAQAEFAKSEIDSGKYEKTRQFFAQNPNASPEQAAQVLGKNYVGWRIDDPKYAPSGNAKRKAYGDNLDKQLSAATQLSMPTMPTVNAMVQAPLNAVNSGMTSTVSAKTFAPAIPTTVPKLLARPLPETPKVKQQVSTKEQPPMKVSVVGGNESIGQNVADRHLAHAVTGGLGMDALRMG